MISDLLRAIDCCGLSQLFFYPLPSFADGVVELDHRFDHLLKKYAKGVHHPQVFQRYNPPPEEELATFQRLDARERGNMLQRNSLLLSRLFIKNAASMGVAEAFRHHTTLRLLDIGCGYAPNLLGILAYFGLERVEYIGIDNDQERIEACNACYRDFPRVRFEKLDATKLGQTHGLFDLILIQHPNIESPYVRDAFDTIYKQASSQLKPQGRVYSTFYYDAEAIYFSQKIMPQLPPGALRQNTSFKAKILGLNQAVYCPENYSFFSA